jgi:hypothetical protein
MAGGPNLTSRELVLGVDHPREGIVAESIVDHRSPRRIPRWYLSTSSRASSFLFLLPTRAESHPNIDGTLPCNGRGDQSTVDFS